MSSGEPPRVLILGAGINGCALARELALNGVGVWLVDAADIAFGATSRSSRLIHGGLRYLEYGDFALVRESLRERTRLLELAPQFVQPLRLYIPIRRRLGGLLRGGFRFFGGTRSRLLHWLSSPLPGSGDRGLWVAQFGLSLYDRLAGDKRLPRARVHTVGEPGVPRVDAARYHWLCAYTDAQMRYPERFVVALLEDARRLAQQLDIPFRVWTHHTAERLGSAIAIRRVDAERAAVTVEPAILVNATGAWGDLTLGQCRVPSERLFGGTKGSHFITYHQRLRQMLGEGGVYAEASDGRLVFVLPFGEAVLVGTTDERFEDRPERAIASDDELRYLLAMVREVFADVDLTERDVDLHYSGVRPLPHVAGGLPGAIPRGHSIVEHETDGPSVYTLIGGKLTTCRALAEEAADRILSRLSLERTESSRKRIIPGGENYPADDHALEDECRRLAEESGLPVRSIRAMWSLVGTRLGPILGQCEGSLAEMLQGTNLPLTFVRWVIRHEWVATLDDLVERRLMLVYQPQLSRETLVQLAEELVKTNRLPAGQVNAAADATAERLQRFYGKKLALTQPGRRQEVV